MTHVGYDPVAWVFRLIDVSSSRSFSEEQKKIINKYLVSLKNELNKEVAIVQGNGT